MVWGPWSNPLAIRNCSNAVAARIQRVFLVLPRGRPPESSSNARVIEQVQTQTYPTVKVVFADGTSSNAVEMTLRPATLDDPLAGFSPLGLAVASAVLTKCIGFPWGPALSPAYVLSGGASCFTLVLRRAFSTGGF